MGLVKRVALGMALLTLLVWIVYTVVFVEGVGFHKDMIEWMAYSGVVAACMISTYFLVAIGAEEKRRVVMVAVYQQAYIWGAVSLYVFVGGYFATDIFCTITAGAFILLLMMGLVYAEEGGAKWVKRVLAGVIIPLAEVHLFYSAYYFDGPYCRTIGYGIAAALTVVFSIVVIVAWLIEEDEKDERRR